MNLIGHREVPADVFFDEPQSHPGVHVGFTSPRLWITSRLPTILEFASLITTSAFLDAYLVRLPTSGLLEVNQDVEEPKGLGRCLYLPL